VRRPRGAGADSGGTPHPPLRWFADRADGLLAPARAAELDRHLATGCVPCVQRDEKLRAALGALRSGPLPPPPRDLRAAAVRLAREARLRGALARAGAVVARLVFDGRAAPALALRSAPGDERRLLWTAGPWEVDACVVCGLRSADVLGQVVAHEDRAETLIGELVARSGRRTRRAHLAADGRFALRDLAAGVWTAEVRVGATTFSLPPFQVECGA
jgi:hypothetical protein